MEKDPMENALKYVFTFFLNLEDDLKEKDLIGTSSNGKESKLLSSNSIWPQALVPCAASSAQKFGVWLNEILPIGRI